MALMLTGSSLAQTTLTPRSVGNNIAAKTGSVYVSCSDYDYLFEGAESTAVCMVNPLGANYLKNTTDLYYSAAMHSGWSQISQGMLVNWLQKGTARIGFVLVQESGRSFLAVYDAVAKEKRRAQEDAAQTSKLAVKMRASTGVGYVFVGGMREALGLTVNGTKYTVTVKGRTLSFEKGSLNATLDGAPITLAGKPFVYLGYLLVPLRDLMRVGCTADPSDLRSPVLIDCGTPQLATFRVF